MPMFMHLIKTQYSSPRQLLLHKVQNVLFPIRPFYLTLILGMLLLETQKLQMGKRTK